MVKRSETKKGAKPNKKDDNRFDNNDDAIEERFAAAETRPQFQAPKQNSSKIVLDKRFSSVLTDSRFQLQEKDKYGRKKKKNERAAAKEDLESFYVVENQEENNENGSDEDNKKLDADDNDSHESDDSDGGDQDDGEKIEDGKIDDPVSRIAYLTAFSRGELDGSSSSEDDDSSQSSDEDEDEEGEDPVYGTAGVLDPSTNNEEGIELSYDSSPYLVVTNMDWENIRAVDLFSILSSFAPPGGIKKVQIFQSDYGMEQMAKDKVLGPTGIWKNNKKISKQTVSHDADDGEDSEEEHSSDDDDSEDEGSEAMDSNSDDQNLPDESDFDSEKLRSYEASKLKYYFAVTEFSHADHADIIYREVDGMEFEHSSTAIDLRTLPKDDLVSVIANRPMRDEATSIPGKYEPPEFVVSALQQTKVQCTWDQGDKERERKLTNYGSTGWQDSFEADDLKAYLASDGSSDEDSDSDNEGKSDKRSQMRKLLGLENDSDEDTDGHSQSSEASSDDDDDDDDEDDEEYGDGGEGEGEGEGDTMSKQIKIIPGKKDLEERIRSKLKPKEETAELTPWEKYQEKRKQKRKDRRQASRGNKDGSTKDSKNGNTRVKDKDDFFANSDESDNDEKFQPELNKKEMNNKNSSKEDKAKAELELLYAGEHEDEEARDYDIRGIQRMEKNKGKKLTGSRKRKEAKIAADVSGTSFKVDTKDNRFQAVLDGSDARFGIDKTDPSFKDTSAMREIISEQNMRRKNKRQKKAAHQMDNAVPDVNADNSKGVKTSGANALSFLVQKLKSRVGKN